MSTLGRTRLRFAADAASFDAPLETLRRATPQFWRGNDVQFELALFFNGALLDVSNLASLTLEIRPLGANGGAPDPSFAPLMGATITSFDNTTTLDDWNAGAKQHAVVVFTAAQSNIAAGAAWLSIFAITNDSPGRVITLCAGPVRVLEDGAGLATTPTPTADTFYTAAESDARFAPIGAGSGAAASDSNPLMDGAAAPGTATNYSRGDHVHPTDTTRAPLASPALTGTPTAPTVAGASDSSTKIATTAFVQAAIAAGSSGGGTWGSITGTLSSQTDLQNALNLKAPLASPTLTGTPAAPTAAVDTNTTQVATTAFVLAQASSSGDGTPAMDGTAARGTSTHYARADHVHPTDTSRAPLASPALTGAPTAPTVGTATDASTKIATTAFVQAALAAYTAPIANDGSGHYWFYTGTNPGVPITIATSYIATIGSYGPLAAISNGGEAALFINNYAATGPDNVGVLGNSAAFRTVSAYCSTDLRFEGPKSLSDGTILEYGSCGSDNSECSHNAWGVYAHIAHLTGSMGYDIATGAVVDNSPGQVMLAVEANIAFHGGATHNFRHLHWVQADGGIVWDDGDGTDFWKISPIAGAVGYVEMLLKGTQVWSTDGSHCGAQLTLGSLANGNLIIAMDDTTSRYHNWPLGAGLTSTSAQGLEFQNVSSDANAIFSFYGGGDPSTLWATLGGSPLIFNVAGQVYGTTLRTAQTTVSGLPSASTAGAGARAYVTDASASMTSGIGATVTGGGSNKVPVYSDGTNWIIG